MIFNCFLFDSFSYNSEKFAYKQLTFRPFYGFQSSFFFMINSASFFRNDIQLILYMFGTVQLRIVIQQSGIILLVPLLFFFCDRRYLKQERYALLVTDLSRGFKAFQFSIEVSLRGQISRDSRAFVSRSFPILQMLSPPQKSNSISNCLRLSLLCSYSIFLHNVSPLGHRRSYWLFAYSYLLGGSSFSFFVYYSCPALLALCPFILLYFIIDGLIMNFSAGAQL